MPEVLLVDRLPRFTNATHMREDPRPELGVQEQSLGKARSVNR